jgi:hypothetical protein
MKARIERTRIIIAPSPRDNEIAQAWRGNFSGRKRAEEKRGAGRAGRSANSEPRASVRPRTDTCLVSG